MKIKLCAALLLASTFIACEKADKDVLGNLEVVYAPGRHTIGRDRYQLYGKC